MTEKNEQRAFSKTGNINQNINNNISNNIVVKQHLTKTKMFKLLKIFIKDIKNNSGNNSNVHYDLKTLPSELNQKLTFNTAPKFKELFIDHWKDLQTLESLMKSEFETDRIVMALKDQYIKSDLLKIKNNAMVVDDGDQILFYLEEYIVDKIENDKDYDNSEFDEEDVTSFAYALLGYCTNKCQILVNPNKKADKK